MPSGDQPSSLALIETKAIAPFSVKAWTREKRELFLAALATSSNVTVSAKAAGLPEASAYRLRRESRDFAAAWQEALCEGYAKLEHMMLERAMKALTNKAEPDAAKTRMEEYSNKLAMGLLAAHRASAKGVGPASPSPRARKSGSAKSRIEARFADMRARIGNE